MSRDSQGKNGPCLHINFLCYFSDCLYCILDYIGSICCSFLLLSVQSTCWQWNVIRLEHLLGKQACIKDYKNELRLLLTLGLYSVCQEL